MGAYIIEPSGGNMGVTRKKDGSNTQELPWRQHGNDTLGLILLSPLLQSVTQQLNFF